MRVAHRDIVERVSETLVWELDMDVSFMVYLSLNTAV
jgi:hypothetical protein